MATAPTAMPAVAPVERAVFEGEDDGEGEGEAVWIATRVVGPAAAPPAEPDAEAEVVEEGKREASEDWNSTVMGCAHMVRGPLMVVLLRSLSPERPGTLVVVPEDRELMQPSKMTEEVPKLLTVVRIVE